MKSKFSNRTKTSVRRNRSTSYRNSNEVVVRDRPPEAQATITVERTCEYASITSNGTSQIYGSLVFQLSDLPGYTELTSAWRNYKIERIELLFLSECNVNAHQVIAGVFTNTPLPFLHLVYDPVDSATPASHTELMEYENHQVFRIDSPIKLCVKPKLLQMLYESGATTAYGNTPGAAWVSTDDPSAKWYGVKYSLQVGADPQASVRVYARYTLCLKGLK